MRPVFRRARVRILREGLVATASDLAWLLRPPAAFRLPTALVLGWVLLVIGGPAVRAQPAIVSAPSCPTQFGTVGCTNSSSATATAGQAATGYIAGGDSPPVSFFNLGASLTATGPGAYGLYVQSNGNDGQSDGDMGGQAPEISVTSMPFLGIASNIATSGDTSVGLAAVSVGGAGHKGADGNFTDGGSNGGFGGAGGAVSFLGSGSISTSGANSYGVGAFSEGGVGGDGGNAGSFHDAGSGASGGNGGQISIDANFQITTSGDQGHGIVARSYGGGGGQGGPGGVVTGGGNGGDTSNGGDVTVTLDAASGATPGSITTTGGYADGIVAQSFGGFGGAGGSGGLFIGYAGSGGSAGNGGQVIVKTMAGTSIFAAGEESHGILAQSIGGGGGAGGADLSITALGGSGGLGGAGGVVEVDNAGLISIGGDRAHAIFAQSIGGGGGSFTNAGTVSPYGQGALGTTTLAGNYTQTSTGVLNINLDVTHPGVSELKITGAASLGGTLFITPFDLATTKVATQTFTVLNAEGGLSNQGLSLSYQPSALLTYSFAVKGDIVRVTYGVEFAPDGFGSSGNDYTLGKALDRVQTDGTSKAFTGIAAKFFQAPTDAALAALYNTLDGEGATGLQQTAFAADDLYAHAVASEIDDWRRDPGDAAPAGQPSTPKGTRLWAQAYGGQGGLAGSVAENSGNLHYSGGGLAAGADHSFAPGSLVGFDLGEDDSSFSVDGRATSGYARGVHVGGYAALRQAGFYGLGLVQGDFFRSTTDRIFEPLGIGERIHGATHADSVTGRVEGGYTLAGGRWLAATGVVAAQVSSLHVDGYAEKTQAGPDLFALAYAGRDVTLPQSDVGLELQPPGTGAWGPLHPYLRVTWRHSFEVTRSVEPDFETFAAAGAVRIYGAPQARDEAVIDARTDWALTPQLTAYASVGGQYGDGAYDTTADVGLRLRW